MAHTSSRQPADWSNLENPDAEASSAAELPSASLSAPTGRPPLTNLEMVCIVARQRSFLAAAEVSGVTHSTISRRVAAVENRLGMTLFERHARGVRLTPDGQRFVLRIEHAFSIIDTASHQWRSPRSPRLVKQSVTAAFAKLWFLKRQAAHESEAPVFRVELDVSPMYADIAGGQVDLAIRYARGICNELEVKPFLPEKLYSVAHPALAAQLAKESRKLGDAALLDVPLLHDSDVAGWHAWFNARDIQFKPRAQDRRFEDYNLVLAAAECGLGVALARAPFADEYLRSSQLVRVSRQEIDSPRRFYFVHAKGESQPEVLALIDRMRRAFIHEPLEQTAAEPPVVVTFP